MSDILHPTIYKDETGELFLELTPDGQPFIHCYIYKWTKENYKHQKAVWKQLLEVLKQKGFHTVYAAVLDEKLVRFAAMFGFQPTDISVEDTKHEIRKVMICSIN